MKGWKYI